MCVEHQKIRMSQVTQNQHMSFYLHKLRCKPLVDESQRILKIRSNLLHYLCNQHATNKKNGEYMQPIGKV